MTIAEALARVETNEQRFADLLVALHAARYTGTLLLHCVEGTPRVVELPSLQVRLSSSTPRGHQR